MNLDSQNDSRNLNLTASAHLSDAHLSDAHLSDDQLEDALLGELGAAERRHLQACAPCAARVAELDAALADFRSVTLAWSERRSATLPLGEGLRSRGRMARPLAWAVAASLALLVGLVAPTALQRPPVQRAAQVAASTETAANGTGANDTGTNGAASPDEQISRDNQMLGAIDRELDASATTPAALGLQPVNAERTSRDRAATLRD
jgi:hypothetical protein